jgi:5'-deoxynucleotidase YfbR-like HD superfamily hydrolase
LFVPQELDDICIKALAEKKDDRFDNARDFAREVEEYLEGTKLKEQAARLAERGQLLSEEYRALQGGLNEARRAARMARERTRHWAPVEEKELLWALEDNEAEIERRRTNTFADAV